ncbi:CBO0543 family protein [Paenibacillus sp. 2TAB26]|uniref:CBO0543 family protein n=1 Tax=Paenibacillus sp. 2TAB26 TaxID=3233005 RepID=UPI003F97E2A9
MLYNIIFGFIIPWVLASFIVRKQPILFIVISPVTAVISMIINTIGIYFGFWDFKPIFEKNETISALPMDLGLYAVLGSLLIYNLSKRTFRLHPVIFILIFSLLTTVLEYTALLFGFVMYGNGWNIGWTFISYLIAYLCVTTAWIIAKEHIEVVK